MNIRVAVADDHPALLAGLSVIVSRHHDLTLVGEARNSTELLQLLQRQPADVVVTDYAMPGGQYGDGMALLGLLRRRFPRVRLIVLTGMESAGTFQHLMGLGIEGLLSKSDDFELLPLAIERVNEGQRFLSPKVSELLENAPAEATGVAEVRLTKREIEVLRMFAEGLTVTEIAERVGRSRKTISTQKIAVMKKLAVESNAELCRYAIQHGLVQSSSASSSENEPA